MKNEEKVFITGASGGIGSAITKKFNDIGITNLMLDLKLHDIPETIYKSIKALDNINFGYLTIHGQGGKK